ncbi:MAG: hypothetical protein Q8916_13200 [Bacteroidota bacterium]|nr:hypothetical protein [Bacteroidota bacterium]MDP4231349.1 hypothetical protein [Bacteroidota bacterium]MDP4236532.1 hypothetical protein [Bacteroidota bacterium]
MAENIKCNPTLLKNGTRIYYQFDCDSIWLVHESTNGKKKNIFSTTTEYYGYHFRLDYYLVKEYSHSLLFSHNCHPNLPCDYSLLDKDNGEKLEDFDQLNDQLIYNSTEAGNDFIIYFKDSIPSGITLLYIDSGKKYSFSIDPERFNSNGRSPAFQFEEPILNKKRQLLILPYRYLDNSKNERGVEKRDKIVIDMKKYHP